MIFFYGEIKRSDSPYAEVLKKSFVKKKKYYRNVRDKKRKTLQRIILYKYLKCVNVT